MKVIIPMYFRIIVQGNLSKDLLQKNEFYTKGAFSGFINDFIGLAIIMLSTKVAEL